MRLAQTVDLGLERACISQYLQRIGYWGDAERETRNAFVLSPAAYVVSARQCEDLERLSRAVYAGVEALASRLVELANKARGLTHDEASFLALARNGIRGLLKPQEHDGTVPPVFKVDLVQDAEGRYFIAESDVFNPRGFAYLAFLNDLVPSEYQLVGPGIAAIAKYFRLVERDAVWTIIVPEYERYYYPAYVIFAEILRRQGLRVRIFGESDLATDGEALKSISHVLTIPDTLSRCPEVRAHLLSGYKSGKIRSLYPPAAYLGSKTFLPFLSQQPDLAEFVPKSVLVSKKHDPSEVLHNGTPVILKGAMASGHKEVIFPSMEPERFQSTLAQARAMKNVAWMMQEEIAQGSVAVVVFDDEGNRLTREYFLRPTIYVSREGLVGMELTGRQSKFVHGAPDCIQIPAIMG